MFITAHHLLVTFSIPFFGVKSLYDYGLWSTIVHELKIQPLLHMYDAQQWCMCVLIVRRTIYMNAPPPTLAVKKIQSKKDIMLNFLCISYDFLYSICSAPQKAAQKAHFKYEGILLCFSKAKKH